MRKNGFNLQLVYIDIQGTVASPARSVSVSKRGSSSTVVWNPWAEKAAALGDMPDDDYKSFVCIEAANARADTRQVAPGGTHTLSQTLSV